MDDTIRYLLYMLSKMRAYRWLIDDIESHLVFYESNKSKYNKILDKIKNKYKELNSLYEKELFLFRLSKIEKNNFSKDIDDMEIEDYFKNNLLKMNTDFLYKEIYNKYIKENNL